MDKAKDQALEILGELGADELLGALADYLSTDDLVGFAHSVAVDMDADLECEFKELEEHYQAHC